MKKITNKQKILIVLIALIIIVGAVITATIGLNFSSYNSYNRFKF